MNSRSKLLSDRLHTLADRVAPHSARGCFLPPETVVELLSALTRAVQDAKRLEGIAREHAHVVMADDRDRIDGPVPVHVITPDGHQPRDNVVQFRLPPRPLYVPAGAR